MQGDDQERQPLILKDTNLILELVEEGFAKELAWTKKDWIKAGFHQGAALTLAAVAGVMFAPSALQLPEGPEKGSPLLPLWERIMLSGGGAGINALLYYHFVNMVIGTLRGVDVSSKLDRVKLPAFPKYMLWGGVSLATLVAFVSAIEFFYIPDTQIGGKLGLLEGLGALAANTFAHAFVFVQEYFSPMIAFQWAASASRWVYHKSKGAEHYQLYGENKRVSDQRNAIQKALIADLEESRKKVFSLFHQRLILDKSVSLFLTEPQVALLQKMLTLHEEGEALTEEEIKQLLILLGDLAPTLPKETSTAASFFAWTLGLGSLGLSALSIFGYIRSIFHFLSLPVGIATNILFTYLILRSSFGQFFKIPPFIEQIWREGRYAFDAPFALYPLATAAIFVAGGAMALGSYANSLILTYQYLPDWTPWLSLPTKTGSAIFNSIPLVGVATSLIMWAALRKNSVKSDIAYVDQKLKQIIANLKHLPTDVLFELLGGLNDVFKGLKEQHITMSQAEDIIKHFTKKYTLGDVRSIASGLELLPVKEGEIVVRPAEDARAIGRFGLLPAVHQQREQQERAQPARARTFSCSASCTIL